MQRQRRPKVYPHITQLSGGSSTSISDYDTEEEEANSRNGDFSGIKHVFRDETWTTKYFAYDQKPKEFIGRMGTTQFFAQIPSVLTLFEVFWSFNLLWKIVMETNWYATHVLDAMGNTRGGPKWVNTSVLELKAFLATHMYMDMERQPNLKSFWNKEGSFFHCPTISNIMTWDRFMELRRCLYLMNPASYEHIEKVNEVMINCSKCDGL